MDQLYQIGLIKINVVPFNTSSREEKKTLNIAWSNVKKELSLNGSYM